MGYSMQDRPQIRDQTLLIETTRILAVRYEHSKQFHGYLLLLYSPNKISLNMRLFEYLQLRLFFITYYIYIESNLQLTLN